MFRKFLIAFVALFVLATPAYATRIKDLGAFQGVRPNQLVGYGIVVGLAGTGDDNLEYVTQGMNGIAARFGLTLPPGVNPALKNAAAVMITAELPAFARPGQRVDITVSALGRARSLRGGTLVMSPLRGADNQIYAMAQGNLVVGGLGVSAQDGSQVSVNVPSAGRIPGGATVERAVDTGFATAPTLDLQPRRRRFHHRAADRRRDQPRGRPADRARRRRGVDRDRGAAGRRSPRDPDEPDRESPGRGGRRAGPGDRQCPHRHRRDQRRGPHRRRRRSATAGSPSRSRKIPASSSRAPVARPDRGRAGQQHRNPRAPLADVRNVAPARRSRRSSGR